MTDTSADQIDELEEELERLRIAICTAITALEKADEGKALDALWAALKAPQQEQQP